MSLVTALLLVGLVSCQQLPTGAVERHEALRRIKGTPASDFDDRLPHVGVDEWLRAAAPKRWTVGWTIGDCDEQWVPPEAGEGYRVCATAFLTAPLPELQGAKVLFLIGTTRTGISAKPLVYRIQVDRDAREFKLLDRLGDLIDWLKTTP